MRLARTVLILGLILAACKDAGGPPAALPVAFQVLAGADQVSTVAKELPEAIAIRVMDASAGPVPNYPVNWQALDGGQAFATVAYSGTDGIARQRWTLGPQAWNDNDPAHGPRVQHLVARALHPETGAVLVDDTVTATARPDLATHVTLHNAGGPVGDSTGVGVIFRDQFENMLAPCPAGGAWKDLTWWSADSSIALPTGQLIWGVFGTDSLPYGYVRNVAIGSTTVGVNVDCLAAGQSFSYHVTP